MAEVVACFNILPAKDTVLEKNTAVTAASLRNGHGTGIYAHTIPHLAQRRDVGVSVEKHISLAKKRKIIRIVNMSVSDVHHLLPYRQKSAVSDHRERQYGQINIRVAVSTDTDDSVPVRSELFNHLLRRVLPRKVVSRSVIENISQ